MNTKILRNLPVTLATALVASLFVPKAQATPPGENGLIVFHADVGSGDQLYTVRSDGQDLRQITNFPSPGDATRADWSPDGRHIVFEHDWNTDTQCATVDVIDPDGGNDVSLTQGTTGCEGDPSYTPDGRRIVYEAFNFATLDDSIWVMNIDGKAQRPLIDPWPNGAGFATDPNVSPDGSKLSFIGWDGSLRGPPPDYEPAQGLFVSNIGGRSLRQLLPFALDLAIKHDWAPDGSRIVVTVNANHYNPSTSANIATLRPDGSGFQYLTNYNDPAVNAYVGSYSPDGQYIVFRLEDHGSYALCIMRSDGSHIQQIIPFSSFRPRGMDWGPRPQREHRDQN